MLIYPHEISLGQGFSGQVGLFPLPKVVLFPHTVQPLHIFEPRYVELLADAVAKDGLIAMATYCDGWDESPVRPLPIEPIVGIGRVVAQHVLPNGTSNILLAGVRRARIIRELPLVHGYREARVRVLDDIYLATPQSASRRAAYRQRLLATITRMLPEGGEARGNFQQLLDKDISLGTLADIVAAAMDWPWSVRRRLMAEPVVDRRARMVVARIRKQAHNEASDSIPRPKYPLEFSAN